jgi:hypothetical protein
MDNINIYRGNQHHNRLFKAYQENMWNFTGQGILIPNIDGIEDLFLCKDTSLESQHDVMKFTPNDITLQHYPEMENIWSKHKDDYLLKLLHDGINCASNAQKPFKDMTETECDNFIKNKEYTKQVDTNISTPNVTVDLSRSSIKTDTIILPLSLEDNSTLVGTGAILDKFGADFNIPVASENENIPFDKQTKSFCIKQARAHCEFISMLNFHKGDTQCDVSVDEDDIDENEEGEMLNENEFDSNDNNTEVTLSRMKQVFLTEKDMGCISIRKNGKTC